MTDLRGAVRENPLVIAGALVGAAAVAVAVAPTLPGGLAGVAAVIGNDVIVVSLALVVCLIGARVSQVLRYGGVESGEQTGGDHQPGELVGADIDDPYQALLDDTGDRRTDRVSVQSSLRTAVVETIAHRDDLSWEAAKARVTSGEWTDDDRAAGFLGEDVTTPIGVRLADWLAGKSVERAVTATVEQLRVAAAVSVDTATEDPPATGGDETSDRVEVTPGDGDRNRSGRWVVTVVAAFTLCGIGFVVSAPVVVAASLLPLSFAAHGFGASAPAPVLSVTRTVGDSRPSPGERVTVETTVENVGDTAVAELVVEDSVPDRFRVVDGTPTECDALKPGESLTTRYEITALRGEHTFGRATVTVRNASASESWSASADPTTTVTCRDPAEDVPATGETTRFSGRVPTDTGGSGVEFYATREYHSGDPLRQIDFNVWAKTGEPRTIEFRQTRAARVVIVVDDRPAARKRRREGSLDGVVLGRYAAVRMAADLLAQTNPVGAASLGQREVVRPRRGADQRQRIESLLSGPVEAADQYRRVSKRFFTESEFDRHAKDDEAMPNHGFGFRFATDGGQSEWLRTRIDDDAQVLFVTPLLDDRPMTMARRLSACGNDVRVLSPDVTTTESPGGTVEVIRRRRRQRSLRGHGIDVADWPTDRPLSVALERAQKRWSR